MSLLMMALWVACQPAAGSGQPSVPSVADTLPPAPEPVLPGAAVLLRDSLHLLDGRRIGLVANHTSLIGRTHLADTLLARGVQVVRVFSPEHGFRGQADAGEAVANATDARTGLPVVSLYGNNKKPTAAQLAGLDLVIFDLQDVGTRHYTYISTMAYVMEACAEQGISMLVLDRPNPNGGYVEGPVMETAYTSFIGMHRAPIVHGMTIGEYARMVNGEKWLKSGVQARLTVIPCQAYTHAMTWAATGLPWVPPSPNLGTPYAAYLYPALCWLEPTPVSVGRGTHDAFTIVGAPWLVPPEAARQAGHQAWYGLTGTVYTFTPVSIPGKSKTPPFQDQVCTGYRFSGEPDGPALMQAGLALLTELYQGHKRAGVRGDFFGKNFATWAGNTRLQAQIVQGQTPEEIWQSWQPGVEAFKNIRSRYLLYP
ncbi:MAG: DUF1343 domain-containing protein [Bacteroidia bacterium]|nr:DUF1343 domain-containing protein [Bacteroidia bacterium]